MTTSTASLPNANTVPEGYTREEFEELCETNPSYAISLLTNDNPVLTGLAVAVLDAKQFRRKYFYDSASRMLAFVKSKALSYGYHKQLTADLQKALQDAVKIIIGYKGDQSKILCDGYYLQSPCFEFNADGDIIKNDQFGIDFEAYDYEGNEINNRLPISSDELASCFEFDAQLLGGQPRLVPGSLKVTDPQTLEKLLDDYVNYNDLLEPDYLQQHCDWLDVFITSNDVSEVFAFCESDIYDSAVGIQYDVQYVFNS